VSRRSRLDRLAQAALCRRCADDAGGVVFRWLEPGDVAPEASAEDGEASCGRSTRPVIYVRWLS
jgi:hypothetical protein